MIGHLRRKKSTKKKTDFESKNKIEKLKVLCVIAPRTHGAFYTKAFSELDVSCCFEVYGRGMATKEIIDILGISDNKKTLVVALIKESDLEKVKNMIRNRFNVSNSSRGIAFTIPVDSMAGVIIYKFLTNTRL